MLNNRTIAVVLPAYNAEKTLEITYREIPLDVVDWVILVDDRSDDKTVELSKRLGIETVIHQENLGYGGNQKTLYTEALKRNADIIVMVHPDYQYSPRLISALASMIAYGEYDAALGSRILAQNAVAGGMPRYKYFSNRVLTLVQNILLGQKLSEYHTGFRAFRREILETLPLNENSNDFLFDNEMMAQIVYFGFRVGEISCPTRYTGESSSISFSRSLRYGFGVILVSIKYFLSTKFSRTFRIFDSAGKRLTNSQR